MPQKSRPRICVHVDPDTLPEDDGWVIPILVPAMKSCSTVVEPAWLSGKGTVTGEELVEAVERAGRRVRARIGWGVGPQG